MIYLKGLISLRRIIKIRKILNSRNLIAKGFDSSGSWNVSRVSPWILLPDNERY